ncbi:MAG: helix-turn-helix domain-containing protein [Bacteriovoracia bacterium]
MSGYSLGEFLRNEREKRGVTIEQVASATKISVRLLHSLETDDYTDLPAKPFVRGFVISYARFIGLDAREIFKDFSIFLEEKTLERPAKDAGHSGYAFEKRETERSRTLLWVMMGSFVVIGAIAIFILKPALKHKKVSHMDQLKAAYQKPGASPSASASGAPETTASAAPTAVASPSASPSVSPSAAASTAPVATASPTVSASPTASVSVAATPTATPSVAASPTATPSVAVSPVASPTPSPTEKFASADPRRQPQPKDDLNKGDSLKAEEIRYKVVLRPITTVWIRYKVDGRPSMRFTLEKGKLLVLRAQDQAVIQASNPESLAISFKSYTYTPLKSLKNTSTFNGALTAIYPRERVKTMSDPFAGLEVLPKTASPTPEELQEADAANAASLQSQNAPKPNDAQKPAKNSDNAPQEGAAQSP